MRLKVLWKDNLKRFLVVAIALAVIFTALISGLICKNYFTCKVTASLELSENSEYDLSKFKLVLISQSGRYKEYNSDFQTRSDSCSIRVLKGEYAVGFEYDEELYLSDMMIDVSDSEAYMFEYSEEDLPIFRAVKCSFDFYDSESYSLYYPSEIIPFVIDENGETLKTYAIEDGSSHMSVILMDDDTINWTVNAEGYEPVTIKIAQDDRMVFRVSELEVDLYEE